MEALGRFFPYCGRPRMRAGTHARERRHAVKVRVADIFGITDPLEVTELLKAFDYTGAVWLGGDIYKVDAAGAALPGVSRVPAFWDRLKKAAK